MNCCKCLHTNYSYFPLSLQAFQHQDFGSEDRVGCFCVQGGRHTFYHCTWTPSPLSFPCVSLGVFCCWFVSDFFSSHAVRKLIFPLKTVWFSQATLYFNREQKFDFCGDCSNFNLGLTPFLATTVTQIGLWRSPSPLRAMSPLLFIHSDRCALLKKLSNNTPAFIQAAGQVSVGWATVPASFPWLFSTQNAHDWFRLTVTVAHKQIQLCQPVVWF